MRIAITADPDLPVPPKQYGGIERVVHQLTIGLTEQGHSVVLFGNPKSKVPCELVPFAGLRSGSLSHTCRNAIQLNKAISKGRFHVVHSFARLAYLLGALPSSVPKLMSYQRAITPRSISWSTLLSGKSLEFTACSRSLISRVQHLATWHVVYNAVGTGRYRFQPQVSSDAPLVFLGRIEKIKGPHTAIEVARRTNRRLIIAGNIEAEHQEFFDKQILPKIDGSQISFIGPVDDAQKNSLLGSAAALLMPIEWEEPFGIVMAEALACGTPVIGFRRGSVPEVVVDGLTGFVRADIDSMAEAVTRIGQIDRVSCRRSMETSFSTSAMVEAYLKIYRQMSKAKCAA